LCNPKNSVIATGLTGKLTAIDTSNLKIIGRNYDSNNIVASQSRVFLPYNCLKYQNYFSLKKLTIWLLEQSVQVTISVCSLRNTELTATDAGYIQNSTGNARLP